MMLGRSYGVAVAFLLFAGTFFASGSSESTDEVVESTQELEDAKKKINVFFDTFDDVITDQALRLADGIAPKDDVMNENLLKLDEVAEDLEDEIYDEAKREKQHEIERNLEDMEDDEDEEDNDEDDNDEDDAEEERDEDDVEQEKDEDDAMERMQADAASLIEDTSRVLKDAEKKLTANSNDAKLNDELIALKSKANGVLDSLKEADAKKKIRRSLRRKKRKLLKGKKNRKRKNKKNRKGKKNNKKGSSNYTTTKSTSEVQSDSSTTSRNSPLWLSPLTGRPVSGSNTGKRPSLTNLGKGLPVSKKLEGARSTGMKQGMPQPGQANTMPPNSSTPVLYGRPVFQVPTRSKYPKAPDDGLGRSNVQYYDTTGLQKYLEDCKDCVDTTKGYECPLNNEVLEMKKWAGEVQEVLSFGCNKPESCNEPGVCCINDKFPFKQTVVQMTQMLKDIYNIFQQKCKTGCKEQYADPAWSAWSSWSSCSKSCGRGVRERRRLCDNPAPRGNQRYCLGKAVEVDSCQDQECCEDGNWSSWESWGTCSATCGQGFQERARSCDDPRPNSCGKPCNGPDRDIQQCKGLSSCCVDGNWSPWNTWSTCSATCGSGFQERDRSCDSPRPNQCGRLCSGSDKEMQPCVSPMTCCIDGDWASWSRWSPCSATCGKGVSNRKRRCDNPVANYCGDQCFGPSTGERECGNSQDCCRDGSWSSWSTWSSCSNTCGNGLRSRIRRCDNPSPNFCGQRCPGSPYDTLACKEKDCCVDGNWGLWTSWEGCSTSCGRGNQLRRRDCDSPAANFCGEACSGIPVDLRSCNKGDCCVDGNWASWGSWSSCSATCGNGTQVRDRQCSNPPANSCGRSCPGSRSDIMDCSSGPCALRCRDGNWSPWSSWTSCSDTCGNGMRGRVRTCSDPSPSFCGRKCSGSGENIEPCDRRAFGALAVDGNWGPWRTWSSCSVSCGIGTRQRRRYCDSPVAGLCGRECSGSDFESDDCDTRVPCTRNCIDGDWGSWMSWSDCSEDCEEGIRTRRRLCDSPRANFCGQECPGRDTLYERCNNADNRWSIWSSWSQCSVTCGTGREVRSRTCFDPTPNSCPNARCEGDRTDRRRCDLNPCTRDFCVDGNWGSWALWSSCSVTCGQGSRSRSRACDNPRQNSCGRDCPGNGRQDEVCNQRPCQFCVDGDWGSWTRWSSCSTSCGQGTRNRLRICDNPSKNFCGQECPGSGREDDVCNQGPCQTCVDGDWGSWTRWSSCSTSCGQGTRNRLRICDNPSRNFCGQECPGSGREDDVCNQAPCQTCVNGNWGSWNRWSSCSASCGQGTRNRLRICDNPSRNSCGQDCRGSGQENDVCNQGQCQSCVDGNWGSWQLWSSCSATCGQGSRRRLRICDNPSRNSCGRDCPGSDREADACNSQPCQTCVDGNWATWSSWSTCPVTCGPGVIGRTRTCSNPAPDRCGKRCEGFGTERKWCYNNACREVTPAPLRLCVDGNWGSWDNWSSCSATCGDGIRERSRRCDRPSPNGCGQECPGDRLQTGICQSKVTCDTQACVDGGYSSWVTWGSCSVTCGRGQRSFIRTCDNPTPNRCGRRCQGPDEKAEDCQERPCGTVSVVDEPTWVTWGSWKPCNCRTATRTRIRQCVMRSTRNVVDIKQCQGSSNDEEKCDVRTGCPDCIETCAQRPDGLYPSCASCAQYLQCVNGREDRQNCPRGQEWDGLLKRCVSAPTSTCSIADCVDDCRAKADGRYQSCGRCNAYVECSGGRLAIRQCSFPTDEFNQHTQRCESTRSPTCPRVNLAPFTSARTSRRRWQNDAPAAESDEADSRQANRIPEMTVKVQVKKPGTKYSQGVSRCIKTCLGLEPGRYPSCNSCNNYVVCKSSGELKERQCRRRNQWDDARKKCLPRSSTCVGG